VLTQPDPPFLPLHAVLVPIEGERWIIAIADHHVNRAAGDLEEPQQQFWFPSRQRQCSLRAAHAVLLRERGGSVTRLVAKLTVCGLSAGGNRIRTSSTAEDARLVAGRFLRAQRVETDPAKKGVRIRQSLACAALRRERWARLQPVLSVSDPRGRAAREPAGADRAPSCSPSSGWCASNRMLPAPGCASRRP